MKRLVLFDIDGTLLNGGKLWRECFEASFSSAFPGEVFPKVAFSGKTDRQICAEVLDLVLPERTPQTTTHLIDELINHYLEELRTALAAGRAAEDVEVLPGVRELLRALSREAAVHLGLLTGNVRQGATLKLSCVSLDRYFGIGAFGDDSPDRYQLPSIAVRRAHVELGTHYEGKEVVIIGDTHHDVNCGKSIGVRSIAVGTGRSEYRNEILASSPDYFFETLQSTADVLQAIIEARD